MPSSFQVSSNLCSNCEFCNLCPVRRAHEAAHAPVLPHVRQAVQEEAGGCKIKNYNHQKNEKGPGERKYNFGKTIIKSHIYTFAERGHPPDGGARPDQGGPHHTRPLGPGSRIQVPGSRS